MHETRKTTTQDKMSETIENPYTSIGSKPKEDGDEGNKCKRTRKKKGTCFSHLEKCNSRRQRKQDAECTDEMISALAEDGKRSKSAFYELSHGGSGGQFCPKIKSAHNWSFLSKVDLVHLQTCHVNNGLSAEQKQNQEAVSSLDATKAKVKEGNTITTENTTEVQENRQS
eukprot:4875677-Ditylum_brightwellii.AAC.1